MSYLVNFLGKIKQSPVGVLFSQTNTVTVASTASETTLSGTGVGSLTLPANFLIAGRVLRFRAEGFYSSVAATTIRIKVKLGSTVVSDTGVVVSVNDTNAGIVLDSILSCRTTGGSGTIFAQGRFHQLGALLASFLMGNTATTTVDTTASQAITITVQFGTSSASNTISLTNFTVEALN